MINGQSKPKFCADTFILDLEGNKFLGLADMFSAAGQESEEMIYDFSLYYAN